jgi:hypothetical protein
VPQGELLEPENTREALTPVQLELIETVSNQDEKIMSLDIKRGYNYIYVGGT